MKRRELDALASLIEGCRKAGVRLMAGSEIGFAVTPYGEWHARELELLVKLGGLTPMEALMAATKNNADTIGFAGQVGTLEPGMLADILIVDGDPLTDIRILQDRKRITCLMKDGQIIPVMDPLPSRRQLSHERNLTISIATIRPSEVNSRSSAEA